jgi:hypothetical protein
MKGARSRVLRFCWPGHSTARARFGARCAAPAEAQLGHRSTQRLEGGKEEDGMEMPGSSRNSRSGPGLARLTVKNDRSKVLQPRQPRVPYFDYPPDSTFKMVLTSVTTGS